MSALHHYPQNTQFLEFCGSRSEFTLKPEHNIFSRRLPQIVSQHQEWISLEWKRHIFVHKSAACLFLSLLEHSVVCDREADIPFGYGNQQQKQCRPRFSQARKIMVFVLVRHNGWIDIMSSICMSYFFETVLGTSWGEVTNKVPCSLIEKKRHFLVSLTRTWL